MRKNILVALLPSLFAYAEQTDLDTLLGNLQQAEDLSKKTIQESAGYVITYTREDLDRMHIKSLKEILERLPFLRYNEDAEGLTDLLYIPFQPTQYGQIKLYIDDKEASDAIFGNSLQVFSEMDISYIDHIEIYLGAVSFTLGTEPSMIIIKLYTKDPSRENSRIVDISEGSYGKKDITYLDGNDLGDTKYLFYANHRDNRRKKIKYRSTKLLRDKKFDTGYFLFYKGKLRYELFASRIDLKPFTANAVNLEPKSALISTRNFFTGLRYDDPQNGWTNYVYFTYSNVWSHILGTGILGVLPKNSFPYLQPYNSHDLKAVSTVAEIQIKKKSHITKKWELLSGIIGKSRHFEFLTNRFDDIDYSHLPYDKENLFAGYIQSSYLFNDKNIGVFSFKKEKYYENGIVENYDQSMLRAGYIYNSKTFVNKFFAIKADLKPSPMQIIETLKSARLKKTKFRVFAWEIQKKTERQNLSMLYTWMYLHNLIIRDLKSFKLVNNENDMIFNSLDIRYRYSFDVNNKIEIDGFVIHPNYHNNKTPRNLYGAHLIAYNRFNGIDIYNSLVYRRWTRTQGSGLDYSFTLNYQYNRRLCFYLKGINVFDSAITTDYYGYNMIKSQIIKLPNVNVIDRQILVGMEYQF